MTDFRLAKRSEASQVIGYLRQPGLLEPALSDYPGHEGWLSKTQEGLASGGRRALIALDETIVGVAIFLVEQDDPATIDIRNFSIHPSYRGRSIGTEMLKVLEDTASAFHPEATRIMIDAKAGNPIIKFLKNRGFNVIGKRDLYLSGKPDIVLSKPLQFQGAVADPRPSGGRSTR